MVDCFVDTNLLLYAVSTNAAGADRTCAARALVQSADWAWLARVATEFIRANTSPRQPMPLTRAQARRWIETWMAIVDGVRVVEAVQIAEVSRLRISTRKFSRQRNEWPAPRCIPRTSITVRTTAACVW